MSREIRYVRSTATLTSHFSLGNAPLRLWDMAAPFLGVDSQVYPYPGEMHRGWPTWAGWAFRSTQVHGSHQTQAQMASSSWSFLIATHWVWVAKFVYRHRFHVCFLRSLQVLVLVSCFCPYFPVAIRSWNNHPLSLPHCHQWVWLNKLGSHHCIFHHLPVLFPGTDSHTATRPLSLAQTGSFLSCQIPALLWNSAFMTINKHNFTSSTKQNVPLLYSGTKSKKYYSTCSRYNIHKDGIIGYNDIDMHILA